MSHELVLVLLGTGEAIKNDQGLVPAEVFVHLVTKKFDVLGQSRPTAGKA